MRLDAPHWKTPAVFDDAQALWEAVCKHELEGVVAKPLRSRYMPGERGWIKTKNRDYWRLEFGARGRYENPTRSSVRLGRVSGSVVSRRKLARRLGGEDGWGPPPRPKGTHADNLRASRGRVRRDRVPARPALFRPLGPDPRAPWGDALCRRCPRAAAGCGSVGQ